MILLMVLQSSVDELEAVVMGRTQMMPERCQVQNLTLGFMKVQDQHLKMSHFLKFSAQDTLLSSL